MEIATACRPSLDNQLHPEGIPMLQNLTRELWSGARSVPWLLKGEGAQGLANTQLQFFKL